MPVSATSISSHVPVPGLSPVYPAGDALTVEEDVFGLSVAGKVRFGDDAGRHVPVERAGGAVGLFDAVAVSIVEAFVPLAFCERHRRA